MSTKNTTGSSPTRPAEGVQVASADHYLSSHYLSPHRMASIGYQVSFLSKYFGAGNVLEIGTGSGVTRHLLTLQGNAVSTLDVDERLKPDIVGSVTEIPASDEAFDAFVCCQVLEHIPWEAAQMAMRELYRVSRRGGVISVPTNRARCFIKLFNRSHTGWQRVPIPLRRYKHIRQPDQHHWELETRA
jgi:SAM-dependent methyltransferase